MNRKLLISLHLYLAAFFAPAIILVAISGGLYLIGEKGSVVKEKIYEGSHPELSASSSTIKADVSALLKTAGVSDYNFEYVKLVEILFILVPHPEITTLSGSRMRDR